MADRTGIFAGDDPFLIILDWMREARLAEPNDPEAAALATVDSGGTPNVRMVLVKAVEEGSLLFFTNFGSAKAREIDAAGKAALVFHWKSLRRQIRARGLVEQVSGNAADDYFATRSPESRLGAWASDQSSALSNRKELEARLAAARSEHGDNPRRPEFWGGFRLTPLEIEFWCNGEHRLHDRFVWRRFSPGACWTVNRLFP